MHHPLIDVDGLIAAPGLVIQLPAHLRIGHHIGTPVEEEEGDGDLREPHAEMVGGPHKLSHRPQPWLPGVSHGIARGDDPLLLDSDRFLDEIGGGHDGEGGQQLGDESEDVRDRPWRPDAVGDLAHGSSKNSTIELQVEWSVMLLLEMEMDEEADGAAHGLTIQEALGIGMMIVVIVKNKRGGGGGGDDGVEVGDAIMDDGVEMRDEGLEAVGSAVSRQIEGVAGKAVLGQEDRGGLEGPTDVVAVAMNHEHRPTPPMTIRRRKGKP